MTDRPAPDRVPFRRSATRGLVFDLDGTLVDSYQAITESVNSAREKAGLAPLTRDVVRAHVGRGLERLLRDLVGPDRIEESVREFRRRYAEVYAEGTFALPGVRETVRELHARGYRMSVASNKPARFSEPILRELAMLEWFDAVQGPDRAGTTKPDPRMIGLCVAAMEVEPAAAVYVGDMVLDVESADRAGLPVLLIPGGSSAGEALRGTGAPVLGSIEELLSLLPERAPGRNGAGSATRGRYS